MFRVFGIGPPLVMHQDQIFGLAPGQPEAPDDRFDEVGREHRITIANRDDLTSRLKQAGVVALVLMIRALLTTGEKHVGLLECFGSSANRESGSVRGRTSRAG